MCADGTISPRRDLLEESGLTGSGRPKTLAKKRTERSLPLAGMMV
ncbi:MAG TPA: hypothetical protein VGG75_17420 [Trebonia sp.]